MARRELEDRLSDVEEVKDLSTVQVRCRFDAMGGASMQNHEMMHPDDELPPQTETSN